MILNMCHRGTSMRNPFGGLARGRSAAKKVDDKAINIATHDDIIELRYNRIVYSKLKRGSILTGLYWDYMTPAAFATSDPHILLIGLGGGTIPVQLGHYLCGNFSLDIVEVSGHVVDMAREFMSRAKGFLSIEAPKFSDVIIGDGYDYLSNTGKTYDVIMLDAYVGDSIPKEFLTERFAALAASKLSENGVLAINYAMNFMQSVQYRRYAGALKRHFNVYQIGDRFISGNLILVCLKGGLGKAQLLSSIRSTMAKDPNSGGVVDGYTGMKLL